MGDHKITVSVNSCVLCGITFHKDLPIPLMVHYELPVNVYYAPGARTHALTEKVLHKTHPIMKDGHDCGPNIIHIALSVANIFYPLIIMGSSRKNMFSASTVLMEDTPTACCNTWPPTPMQACSEVFGIPLVFPIDNESNNVLVGMTGADWAAGIAAFAIEVVFGLVTMFPGPDDAFSFASEIDSFLGIEIPDPKKLAVAMASSAVKIALTGQGSIEVGVGNRGLGGKLSVKKKKTGDPLSGWELESEGDLWFEKHSMSTGEENTTTTKETETDWFEGTSKTRETKTKTNPDGSKTVTVTETSYDQQGRPTSNTTTTTSENDRGQVGEPKTVENPRPQDPIDDALGQSEDTLL